MKGARVSDPIANSLRFLERSSPLLWQLSSRTLSSRALFDWVIRSLEDESPFYSDSLTVQGAPCGS